MTGRRRAGGGAWWRGESGQSTAMVLSMLMIFILLVAMVVNVGQAVNRRIALQIVADAGAFTGATIMAEGLNYMAYANSFIHDLWGAFTIGWRAAQIAGSTCKGLTAVVGLYSAARAPFAAVYETINRVYSLYPYAEAWRVSQYNLDDLFPKEDKSKFSFREVDFSAGVACLSGTAGLCRDAASLMDSRQVRDGTRAEGTPPALFSSERRRTQPCTQFAIPPIAVQTWTTDVWFERSDTAPRYFVWRVQAPAVKALMFDWYFGPNAIPEMKAVGVAKPVGGEIKRGRSRYVAKLVPTREAMVIPGVIRDPDIGVRFVTH